LTSPLLADDDTDDPAADRRSLVLAGGGMRVAYQAGVLLALEQAGLRFQHVDGSSGGTMNLSMLLSGLDGAEICQRWRTLRQRRFGAALPWRAYGSLRWPALGSADGLREQVFPHLGIDPALIRRAAGVIGTYNVCNFATKTAEVVEHPDVDMDLLVAAVSLPVLMPAVERFGTPYTDAVWIRDSNIPEAVARGSDDIWLVWCIGNTATYHNGLFRQYVHMIEMAANGSLLRDLGYVAEHWPKRPVRVHVIKPEYPLPLDPAYFTGQIDAATLIALGYADARRYLDSPAPLTAPWQPSITQMREAPPGAAARLVLSGSFTRTGPAPAERAGNGIELHLQLQARDGDGGSRELTVAGDVTAPGLRPHTLIERGTAVLDPAAGLTLRLCWRDEAGPVTLLAAPAAGGLAVTLRADDAGADDPGADDPGADDAGTDHKGTVLGTGTIPVSWRQLARALASVHATDAGSTAQAVRHTADMGMALLRAAGR
jgi:predicted patatin/cPLA2 family phospholipase